MTDQGYDPEAKRGIDAEAEEDDDYIVIPDFLFESAPENNVSLQELGAIAGSLDDRLEPLARAFLHNLESVYELLSLPLGLIFQTSSGAWLVSNVFMSVGRDHPKSEFPVMRMKKSEFKELVVRTAEKSRDNVDGVASFVRMNLTEFSGRPEFVSASQELLNQGLVLTWASLEVLVGDAVCETLNARPGLVARILDDPSAKRFVPSSKFSLEQLGDFGFDLSSSLGTLLTGTLNMGSIRKIKVILTALFKSPELKAILQSKKLYLLGERRHLLVHRRGVVDAKYVKIVGDGRAEGERLQVDKQELEGALEEVAACGLRLLRVAHEEISCSRGSADAFQ